MEGTLSLFDWRPGHPVPAEPMAAPSEPTSAPEAPMGAMASGSGPCAQLAEPGDPPVDALAEAAAGKPRKSRGKLKATPAAEPDGAVAAADPAAVEPARKPAVTLSLVPASEPAIAVAVEAIAVEAVAVEAVAVEAVAVEARASGLPGPLAALATGHRVVVFDCETTGTDRLQDQVIELCVQRGLDDDAPSQTWRIKPSVAIHPGAQAVHGIAQADLEGAPSFAQLADEIAGVFAETDVIVGYNIAFDIDMLQAEYTRCGRPLLDLNGKKIIDAFRLWQQCEPRSLQHAHQRFVGAGFASAHSASADVAATGRVLTGMLHMFNLADHDWEAIACKCDPQYAARAAWVGPSRHLRWEGEVIVLGFGKHANAPLHQLAAGPDRSFLRWVVERDFPMHVGEVCRAALDLGGDEFLAWARRKYPPPPLAALVPGTSDASAR